MTPMTPARLRTSSQSEIAAIATDGAEKLGGKGVAALAPGQKTSQAKKTARFVVTPNTAVGIADRGASR